MLKKSILNHISAIKVTVKHRMVTTSYTRRPQWCCIFGQLYKKYKKIMQCQLRTYYNAFFGKHVLTKTCFPYCISVSGGLSLISPTRASSQSSSGHVQNGCMKSTGGQNYALCVHRQLKRECLFEDEKIPILAVLVALNRVMLVLD